jgi:hypothetical protein
LSNASDWTDPSYATEPHGRGRLLPLVLVIVLVVGIGGLAYVGLQLAHRVGHVASSLAVHTVHDKSSPDGTWALAIDTHDEGALGGSTTVTLKPASGTAPSYTLFDGNWLPDSAVRWRDARTVSIAGELQTPFVAHAVATGSETTTGVPLDAAGYARNTTVPGERVVLLSGLSLVLPHGASGELATRRVAAELAPWQRLTSSGAAWSVATYAHRSDLSPVVRSARLIGRSWHARVVVRWDAAAQRLYVVTRLPGRMTGLVTLAHVHAATAAGARAQAAGLWQLLSVEGVALPSS